MHFVLADYISEYTRFYLSLNERIILLCSSGSDEVSEPQPIPPLLAGYDKDWLSLSPYALRYWDKLLLEPYSKQHDIAYIVVAPDNDYILSAAQVFFKELSTVYELCRLGKHCPISRDLRDGIIRISKKAASKLSEEPVNEWFTFIGENISCTCNTCFKNRFQSNLSVRCSWIYIVCLSLLFKRPDNLKYLSSVGNNNPMCAKLKLYAQVCAHQLGKTKMYICNC